MNKEDVVIVVPVHRATPKEYEIDALKQMLKILGEYHITFVCPFNLNLDIYRSIFKNFNKEFCVQNFDKQYFKNYTAYNKFCLSSEFYQAFSNYEYMLICHLDAWVFKDELLYWCNQGYDYIGAPLSKKSKIALNLGNINAGNGGFSLRKISSMIKLTNTDIRNKKLNNYKSLKSVFFAKRKKRLISNIINIPIFLFFYIFQFFIKWQFIQNEDLIIGYYSTKYMPEFKIAPDNIAEKFALEYNTKKIYKKENFVLPFGCHNPSFYIYLIYKESIKKENIHA